MFVDKVEVTVEAGNGGDGKLSFRHEKFIARGGPDGGDGGNGGDVVLLATRNENTLASFRYKKLLKADSGQPGGKAKKHGKTGSDLVLHVPVGTQVLDSQGELVADMTSDQQQSTIAKGGNGGFGNAHFTSSRRQAPRIAEKGEPGEHINFTFELKIIADVGLVGLPNAGKSTLLARVSNAHPEIANYPFTTLHPNLGVADIDNKHSLLLADIPGLIEGASAGKGLGDEFLRHVERTPIIVHVIDAYEEVTKAYKTIQAELKAYRVDLTKRPQIVVLNKTEGLNSKEKKTLLSKLQKLVPLGTVILTISAQSGEGVDELLYCAQKLVTVQRRKAARKVTGKDKLPVLRLADTGDSWQVIKIEAGFRITGQKIERFAKRTDFSNEEAVQRLRDIMRKMGILHELERQGIEAGQKIVINTQSVDY